MNEDSTTKNDQVCKLFK